VVTSLGIALREGIEAALIIGIVLMYLAKTGRMHLKSYVYGALGGAVLVSIGLAVAFETIGFDSENAYFEGALLAVAGLFVITMVLWMWRAARGLRAGVENRVETITSDNKGTAMGWGLFGFVFFMVLREGAELVLFLKAATLGSEASAGNLIGALIGLALAVLFAVLFVRGSVRVNIKRFFRYTSWALLLLGVKLILHSLHEFGEMGALPVGNRFFDEAGVLTGGLVGDILMSVIIAVPVVLLLWDASSPLRQRWTRGGGGEKPPVGPTAAAETASERN
jgi:FTR1 family protein